MPLLEAAQVGLDGAKVQTPKAPYQLFYKPTQEVRPHCNLRQLLIIAVMCRLAWMQHRLVPAGSMSLPS